MNKEKILTVDDAPDTREIIKRNLESEDYSVFTASNVKEAIKILESEKIDLVITDLKMPEISGIELIRHIRENFKNTEVIMITGYPSIETAVQAVKIGASEYLTKPFTDEELIEAVENSLKKLKTRTAADTSAIQENKTGMYGLIGVSKKMEYVYRTIEKAAKTNATVLITGESGTGKELIARAIHYNSPRASSAFVPVNCGAIPEELLESELFGHVKGAFTGAYETRAGFFQTADGGTLFLDEISNTSLAMQAKLLRVLQNKEVSMVGTRKTQQVDVRILAATNKSLLEMIKKGHFREDLFYRLNVIPIEIPPLKDREDDVLLLSDYFASKFASEYEMKKPEFTDKALETLKNYSWPGNVRELENLIQRSLIMSDSGKIDVPDLPDHMHYCIVSQEDLNRTLEDIEIEYITKVLENSGGNKTKAAEILGIDRKTLREKLKKSDKE